MFWFEQVKQVEKCGATGPQSFTLYGARSIRTGGFARVFGFDFSSATFNITYRGVSRAYERVLIVDSRDPERRVYHDVDTREEKSWADPFSIKDPLD